MTSMKNKSKTGPSPMPFTTRLFPCQRLALAISCRAWIRPLNMRSMLRTIQPVSRSWLIRSRPVALKSTMSQAWRRCAIQRFGPIKSRPSSICIVLVYSFGFWPGWYGLPVLCRLWQGFFEWRRKTWVNFQFNYYHFESISGQVKDLKVQQKSWIISKS